MSEYVESDKIKAHFQMRRGKVKDIKTCDDIPREAELVYIRDDNDNYYAYLVGDGKTPMKDLPIFYNKEDIEILKQQFNGLGSAVETINDRINKTNDTFGSHINAMKIAYKFEIGVSFGVGIIGIILGILGIIF